MSLFSFGEGKRLCSHRLGPSWAVRMMDGVVLTPTLQEAPEKSRGFYQQELLSDSDTRLDAHLGLRIERNNDRAHTAPPC